MQLPDSTNGPYPKLPRFPTIAPSAARSCMSIRSHRSSTLCPPRLLSTYIANMPHSDHTLSPPVHAFVDLPPFPGNVPTAPLLRISLEKLLEHDPAEEERCWKACRELGFFYLNLRTSTSLGVASNDGSSASDSGEKLLQDADELFSVMRDFFDLDVEDKVKYDFKHKGSYFGYKGVGEGIVDGKGTRDRNEFYNAGLPNPT
jgi:hypothetical protein